jgi:hypothetical protein
MELEVVMAGLVPAIHALLCSEEGEDARHKAGHDVEGVWPERSSYSPFIPDFRMISDHLVSSLAISVA